MARATSGGESLYEGDFCLWVEEQARLLRECRLDELDIANLLEEVQSLGRFERRTFKRNLVAVLTRLLRYRLQPDQRSNRRRGSILERRPRLRVDFEYSPSLRAYAAEVFVQAYEDAYAQAGAETGLPKSQFPDTSPYTVAQAVDEAIARIKEILAE